MVVMTLFFWSTHTWQVGTMDNMKSGIMTTVLPSMTQCSYQECWKAVYPVWLMHAHTHIWW